MAKRRSRLFDYLVYSAVRAVACFLLMMPTGRAVALMRFAARLAYRLDRRHRQVAAENLRLAFPGRYSDRQLARLILSVYEHFSVMLLEMLLLPRKVNHRNWPQFIHLVNPERWLAVFSSGRPALVVTGHFGNWEMGGYALGLLGFPSFAVGRRLDNPYLDRFLRRFRCIHGQKMLDKSDDYEQILRVLATGGRLATLADQDAGGRGQFVEFFGRPASTFKSIALLALEYDAPLLVCGGPRVGGPMHFHSIVEEVIDPRDYAHRPDAVKSITQRYTAALERLIRRYPEQYFWLHRRWKSQPPVRKAKAA